MLHVPCYFVSFLPFENTVPKCQKNVAHLFVNNWRKFQKFTVSSISHFADIKEVSYNFSSWWYQEVSYKDWKMSLYKPGQVRACFCWIPEKSQIIQLKISFHHDFFSTFLFVWTFFKDANFVIFSVDFLVWSLNIFHQIIGIKIQIWIACFENNFL